MISWGWGWEQDRWGRRVPPICYPADHHQVHDEVGNSVPVAHHDGVRCSQIRFPLNDSKQNILCTAWPLTARPIVRLGKMDPPSFGRTPLSRRWCRHTPERSPGRSHRWRRTRRKLRNDSVNVQIVAQTCPLRSISCFLIRAQDVFLQLVWYWFTGPSGEKMNSAAVKWAAGIFMESTAKAFCYWGGGGKVAQLKWEEWSVWPRRWHSNASLKFSQSVEGCRDTFVYVLQNFRSGEYGERHSPLRHYKVSTDVRELITQTGSVVQHILSICLSTWACFVSPVSPVILRTTRFLSSASTGEIAEGITALYHWDVPALIVAVPLPKAIARRGIPVAVDGETVSLLVVMQEHCCKSCTRCDLGIVLSRSPLGPSATPWRVRAGLPKVLSLISLSSLENVARNRNRHRSHVFRVKTSGNVEISLQNVAARGLRCKVGAFGNMLRNGSKLC